VEQALNFLPALLALSFAFLVVQPVFAYLLDRKGLRKFPAPSYAAWSSLWRISQNLRHKHYLAIHHAHQKHGTHVRIAPNHVSISDPQAMDDIYGHGANMLKDAWYDGGAGEYRNMADARIKSEHQAKRKALSHIFAQKTITSLEPVIAEAVRRLVKQVNKHAADSKEINMRRFLNYFTIDVFSELLYGDTMGCLEKGNDYVTAETPSGVLYEVPFIKTLHDSTIIGTALGMEAPLLSLTKKLFSWHSYKKAGADYEHVIYHNAKKRLRDVDAEDDIFSKFLKNGKGEDLHLSAGEILAECSVMMNAGTDTTTAALTNTLFLLVKHPEVLLKLRAELDAAGIGSSVPNYDSLTKMPFLRACIEESLRVRPASSMGLPRVVPKGGRVIAGQFVSEGVTVSTPTYTLLRNEEAFRNPEQFDPDRWETGDKKLMAKCHLPFSTGPRACIGRNIAYFEQLLVITTLVQNFDFEFAQKGFELETIERFNSNPGEMLMHCRKRQL
jgi:cytochrome P450